MYVSLHLWGFNVAFHLQKSNQSCIKMNKIKKTFHLLSLILVLYLLNISVGKQCKTAEASISGKALMGYTFKSLAVRAPFECQVLCENTFHCQSYNFFLPRKICELNNRTKEARPRNFVTDEDRFYVRSWPNRGKVLIKVEYSFASAGRCPRTYSKRN